MDDDEKAEAIRKMTELIADLEAERDALKARIAVLEELCGRAAASGCLF